MTTKVDIRAFEIDVPENIQIGAVTHLTPDEGEIKDAGRIGGFWAVLVLRGRPIVWLLCRERPGSANGASMPGPIREARPERN